jgi:hypothetical protein
MNGARKMNSTDIDWMQKTSSIKGKVNYKHILKRLNVLNGEKGEVKKEYQGFDFKDNQVMFNKLRDI